MNVIILNDYAWVNGGAGKVAISNALGLAARGHNTVYFSVVGPVDPMLQDVPGLKTVCLGGSDLLGNPNKIEAVTRGLWNRTAAQALVEEITAFGEDRPVVHIHHLSKALTSSVIPAAKRAGAPVIFHVHDYALACPNAGFYNYRKQQLCHLRPLSARCILTNCDCRSYGHKIWRVGRQLAQQMKGKLPSSVETFVSVSQFALDVLEPFMPPGSDQFVVENPIDAEPKERVEAEKNRDYTFVGRIVPEKDPLTFAKAALGVDVPARFVGEGSLQEQVREANPGATMTGWLGADEVKRELARSRCLVFPSRWYETAGLVIREAAALGVPAIVSDACAGREYIENEKTGLLFEAGSEASLRQALQKAQDDAFLERVSRGAYESFWSDEPSLERYLDQIEAVYERALGRQRSLA
jgi:glycosyltransferase involved in cell wall biosynthesis